MTPRRETAPANSVRTRALLVAAPASGQGKTTVTAALARHYRRRGFSLRVFKAGPDFLDPMLLSRACGARVHTLDAYMGGIDHCRALLAEAAAEADIVLVEGVMGLYDGEPSCAELARALGLPVLLVIDAAAMAATFGAVAWGLANHRPGLQVAGAFANRVATDEHAKMLRQSLSSGVAWFGHLPAKAELAWPERHLGIVQAEEIADGERSLDAIERSLPADLPLPPAASFQAPPRKGPPRLLAGRRIAVARDAAFAFLYPANLDCLQALGAELRYFSPLADTVLPDCDALWLPGGYPELHLERLIANSRMMAEVRRHHAVGKPILAECGGMLYLAESLADAAGRQAPMVGLLPAAARMEGCLQGLGWQSLRLPEGELRGHSFHYSRLGDSLFPQAQAIQSNGSPGECVYRRKRLTASYLHLFFPSNPVAVASLFLP